MGEAMTGVRDGLRLIFREQHDVMRSLLQEIDSEALNWQPGEETNSLAVLFTHLLGAEESLLATALGKTVERDRDAEFRVTVPDADSLLRRLDQVESHTWACLDQLSAEDLSATRTRPGDRLGRVEIGSWWVFHAVEHNAEHIGQAMLTRQLFDQQR